MCLRKNKPGTPFICELSETATPMLDSADTRSDAPARTRGADLMILWDFTSPRLQSLRNGPIVAGSGKIYEHSSILKHESTQLHRCETTDRPGEVLSS